MPRWYFTKAICGVQIKDLRYIEYLSIQFREVSVIEIHAWITRVEATQVCLPYSHGDIRMVFSFVVFCF
jgi:hypothetical protein